MSDQSYHIMYNMQIATNPAIFALFFCLAAKQFYKAIIFPNNTNNDSIEFSKLPKCRAMVKRYGVV